MNPTSRRKIVLGLTLIGFPVKRIAADLGWDENTIVRDRQLLMRQYNARSIRQLLIHTWAL